MNFLRIISTILMNIHFFKHFDLFENVFLCSHFARIPSKKAIENVKRENFNFYFFSLLPLSALHSPYSITLSLHFLVSRVQLTKRASCEYKPTSTSATSHNKCMYVNCEWRIQHARQRWMETHRNMAAFVWIDRGIQSVTKQTSVSVWISRHLNAT